MFIDLLNKECEITEDKGILSIEDIKNKLTSLFDNEYKDEIDFCYLFGSYAKGLAKDSKIILHDKKARKLQLTD